ncbi:RNA-directed DNA polymerase from mobile element, partial [Brachionus plicatilis]
MEDENIPQVHHDFPMLESQDNRRKRGANHLTYSPSGVQQKSKQKHYSELAAVLIPKLGIRPDDIRVKPTANGNLMIYPEKEEHKTVMLSDEKVFEGYEKIDTGIAKQYSVIVRNIAGSEIEQEDKEKYGMVKVIPFERNGREIKVCKIILEDVSVFEEIVASGWMGLGYTKYPVKECEKPPKRCLNCHKFNHTILSYAPSGFYRNESAMYSNAVYVAKPSSNNDSCMREMGQNIVKLLEMKNTVESIEKRLYKVEELQTKVAELSGTVSDLSNKIVQLDNKVNEFNKIMESNNVIVGHFVTDVIRMVTPSNKANKQLFAQKIHERFTHHKLVFSYYNPPNTEPKKEFFEKLYESKVDFVLAGDLNSKNKILLNSNFCVLNDKSPTHCHFTTQKEDILDLFIASPCFYSKKVELSLKKHDMGSDYYPVLLKLKFEFDLYEKDINNLKKFDLNKAEWDKFRELLPKEVPNEIRNNLEKFNQFITESLVYAATNSIPTFKTRNFKKTLPYY